MQAASGKYVRMSPSAMRLLALREQGMTPPAIAAHLSPPDGPPISAADIEAGLERLDAQLADVAARPLSSGFLFEMPLVPASVVRPVARVLAPLFQRWIAAVLATASIATIVWLFVSRGVPTVTMDAVWPGFGLSLATLLAHELGHAAACARFGAPPSAIGFTMYVVYPAFYCDVSAAWTLSRRQRLVIDVGGFHFQLIAVAALAVGFGVTGWAPLHLAAWMALGTCALSLNPMFKFDGYWIVADALGVANLATERTRILRHAWDRLCRRASPPLPYPRWIRILLLPYTVVSFGFFGWFAYTAAPALAAHLMRYPGMVAGFAAGIARGRAPGFTEVLTLLAATVFALLGVLFFRGVLRGTISATRGIHRHRADIMRAMSRWLRYDVVARAAPLSLALVIAAVLADAAASVLFHAGAADALRGLEAASGGWLPPSLVFAAASAALVVGVLLVALGGLRPRHLGLDGRDLRRGAVTLVAGWSAIQLVVVAAGIAAPPTVAAIAALITQVLVIALVEEIVYRGVLFPQLVRAFRSVASEPGAIAAGVVVSALVFAATHLPGLARGDGLDVAAGLVVLFGTGAIFALLYLRGRSLLTVVALHALINAPTPFASPSEGWLAALQVAVVAAGVLHVALRRGDP